MVFSTAVARASQGDAQYSVYTFTTQPRVRTVALTNRSHYTCCTPYQPEASRWPALVDALRSMWQRFFLFLALLCSSLPGYADDACRGWLEALDVALADARIRDIGSQRIPGYPHLRATRWLASLQREVRNEDQQALWLSLAENEARLGWRAELQRLAPHPLLDESWPTHLDACLSALTALTGFPGIAPIRIADNYSRTQRIAGLYPLARLLATPSMNDYRDEMAARFRRPARLPMRHFQVEPFPGNVPVPADLTRNSLDLPLPSTGATQALLNAYAPVISIADTMIYNQPGAIRLAEGLPGVDYRDPVAYTWISWTRYKGHKLLQLNYQVWFSERPREGAFDLYGGPLDSLVWRVTLKPDGNVLFYDSIHGCGCYHKVYPVALGLAPASDEAYAPVFFPGLAPNARQQKVSVRLEPDTHYVVRVEPFVPGQQLEQYRLQDANTLRALPDDQGVITSLYDDKGLVPHSARAERFLLWPLGVPSAGAMRQPGTHAISFFEKRHFDDADLPEKIFRPAP